MLIWPYAVAPAVSRRAVDVPVSRPPMGVVSYALLIGLEETPARRPPRDGLDRDGRRVETDSYNFLFLPWPGCRASPNR